MTYLFGVFIFEEIRHSYSCNIVNKNDILMNENFNCLFQVLFFLFGFNNLFLYVMNVSNIKHIIIIKRELYYDLEKQYLHIYGIKKLKNRQNFNRHIRIFLNLIKFIIVALFI